MSVSETQSSVAPIGWRKMIRPRLTLVAKLPKAIVARALARTGRATRFAGAYPNRRAADAALVGFSTRGYDDEGIADVSFQVMCNLAIWDYPVLFWLQRLLPDCPALLDAGGHLGTKFIAFSNQLDLSDVQWTVYDLPGIIRAARVRQGRGQLPLEINFVDNVRDAPPVDILLGSGLLQYLDASFVDFVAGLRHRPKYILLNKVALRNGPGFYTVERIGGARVPYQVRSSENWESEILRMGYRTLDSWAIPDLCHIIPTHPWLGRNQSRGYLLVREDQD